MNFARAPLGLQRAIKSNEAREKSLGRPEINFRQWTAQKFLY
jgi:hypothetical protein